MTLRRINHVVLSIRNLDDSARFYCDVLGLKRVAQLMPTPQWKEEMLFLRSPLESTNHHDIALIGNATLDPVGYGEPRRPGLFHLALEVGTLDELEAIQHKLQEAEALVSSTDQGMHLSLYGRDPDGLAVEILWRVPGTDWSYEDEMLRRPLDISTARERWGGQLATGSAAGEPA